MGFWWGNLREREHVEDIGDRWEDNIKLDLKSFGIVWTGLIWLRIRTGSELL
jgi:hypothetical protein